MNRALMIYLQFMITAIIFGELFALINTLITRKLAACQLGINLGHVLKNKTVIENINGLLLELHTNQAGMIYYFNFQAFNLHFVTKQKNLTKKSLELIK